MREIQLTDWSTAGNRSNRSSGVQIPRDICTRFGRYLYSTKCSWIIKGVKLSRGASTCYNLNQIIYCLLNNINRELNKQKCTEIYNAHAQLRSYMLCAIVEVACLCSVM